MRKRIIRSVTVLLAFIAGMGFMSYATYMGNRDMTMVMAEATLPVVYAEKDGELYNELHGHVDAVDGSCMKDSILGLSRDHRLDVVVEKYNAQIKEMSYEVRSLDMGRLIENGSGLPYEDDGTYLHLQLDFKDLLKQGEKYLFMLKMATDGHEEVTYYSQLCYLGENHVQECVDFARSFHDMTLSKDGSLYKYLEVDKTMDGQNLGYVNIHSNSGPVTWGDMEVSQTKDAKLHFTDFNADKVSLVLEYELEDTQTEERYQVEEAFCVQYTANRMYLLAYDRTAEKIFSPERQLVEDGEISFGIQGGEVNFRKNDEENVVGFVQQGQLWSYDFGQNRLSMVYGFQDGDDKRGLYDAHDFRILQVEDSGSMDFLVYGYMNRGRYEGQTGILLCHYDALMNTVEEQFFLPVSYPFGMLKEEIGSLAAVNGQGTAWLSCCGTVLQISLADPSAKILAEDVGEERLRVSKDGVLAAWTEEDGKRIRLLDTRTGNIKKIDAGSGEAFQVLGFMNNDFIYGTAYEEDIRVNMAGEKLFPMYKVVIHDSHGKEVREFDYASRGKYVTGVSIVENRIDLSCIAFQEDGSWAEALPEPITYTNEQTEEKLRMKTRSDDRKRSEYHLAYEGSIKNGSMKRPRVKLVLFEENRTLQAAPERQGRYFARIFTGDIKGFDTLAEAVVYAYDGKGSDDGMGSVWKDGSILCWDRWKRSARTQLEDIGAADVAAVSPDSVAECLQMMFRQKQIYTDVQAELDAGRAVWEICKKELGDACCLLPGCSLPMVLYYIDRGAPVMGITDTREAVLVTGYDAQNILFYRPGQAVPEKAGLKDSAQMFEEAGNLFFTYMP